MAERHTIAIELGRRTLRAVQVSHARSGLAIRRVVVAAIPADINSGDSQALGAWIGSQFEEAGIPRGRAVAGVARELVGVKRLTLPTVDDDELPGMTRLALQREGPLDSAAMAMDFIPQERTTTATSILAVVAPHALIESVQKTLAVAGMTVGRVTLSTVGAAALVDDEPTLIVDFTGDNLELTVVINGTIRFSRAAETLASTDPNALAELIVTETRRTWTSYRTADDASDVAHVLLIGDERVGELLTEPIKSIIGCDCSLLTKHNLIDASECDSPQHWPLTGLLLESARSAAAIDLANPRRAPDLALQRRKRMLLAAAAVILFFGFIWTLANMNLRSLRAQAANLVSQQQSGVDEFNRYRRSIAKLEHLKQWSSSETDWLGHANYLLKFSPPPDQVVLDSWNGSMEPVEVRFDTKKKKWITPRNITIVIDGEARDRETADAFREALVKNSAYTTSSPGADVKGGKRLPWGFTYRLRLSGELPGDAAVTAGADKPVASEAPSKPAPVDARTSTQ